MFFNENPYGKRRRGEKIAVRRLPASELRELQFMTAEDFRHSPGTEMILDIEVYPNLFFVGFEHVATGKVCSFEISPDCPILDSDGLLWVMYSHCLITFNGDLYDLLVIAVALATNNLTEIKRASDFIIKRDEDGHKTTVNDFKQEFNVPFLSRLNHIDIKEVTPLDGSLKKYAARQHAQKMQDLPFDPHKPLTVEEARETRFYCFNDTANTSLTFKKIRPEITLREQLGKQYGVDLRSKSDAQLAEAVICSELKKITGWYPRKPSIDVSEFSYDAPQWVEFQSPQLQAMLARVKTARFVLNGAGRPQVPDELKDIPIRLGIGVYRMGNGGLHSSEKESSHIADEQTILADIDVASFYPRIILNERLCPSHLGEDFLNVYNSIVERRLKAKAEGKKDPAKKKEADSLKIVINGSFGKLGDPYSRIFAPKLMIQVTVTGQLALLMFIELLELAGIPVVSGNTDGIIVKCPVNRYQDLNAIRAYWEKKTGFETEETRYKAVYSRDVNNYYAVKLECDGKGDYLDQQLGIKTKGEYCERGSALDSILSKNPENLIVSDAVMQLLRNGKSIEQTIKECQDIRRFVTVQEVRGGAHKEGVFLGKVCRWYYAKGVTGAINYINGGNQVPNSEGANPCMDLPREFPKDVNYDWYIAKTRDVLEKIGYTPKPKQVGLFF